MSNKNNSFEWELSLKQLNQNEDLAKNMLTVFSKELTTELEKANAAYKEKNWLTLRSIIHKMHGGSVYCGVPTLKDLLKQTEAKLLNEQLNDLPELMQKINAEAEKARREIAEFLKN